MKRSVRPVPWVCGFVWVLSLTAGCAAQPQTGPASIERVEQARSTGSLRGTDLDGEWGPWVDGRLQPNRALRRRFDHLLTALGEVTEPDLRAWIEREVTRERGAATTADVLKVWDGYVALLQKRPLGTTAAASQPPLTEGPSSPRFELLGDAWAHAFYDSEEPGRKPAYRRANPSLLTPAADSSEEQLQALQQQRVQQYGAEAAERLRLEDLARWAWEQRLAQARDQLKSMPGALPAQQAYLKKQFSGRELVRAKALLGLPP